MRSVVQKNLVLVSFLTLSFALIGCGKKSGGESTAALGSSLSSSSIVNTTGLNTGAFSVCSMNYGQPLQVYNYGYLNSYLGNGGFLGAPSATICSNDTVEFTADANHQQYLIYQADGQQIGPVAVSKYQHVKLSVSQNSYIYFGRDESGWVDINNLVVRRCFDGSNNKIACP